MKTQIKFCIFFMFLASPLLTGCGGTKKKEIVAPTQSPGTATQPTVATGSETGQPSSPELDPVTTPTEPTTPTGSETGENGELTNETVPGQQTEGTTSTTGNQTITNPNIDSQGTGTGTGTGTGIGSGLPNTGSNLAVTLVTLIQNPKDGMMLLLGGLIGALTAPSSGGGTGSLISGVLGGGPNPGSNSNQMPVSNQQDQQNQNQQNQNQQNQNQQNEVQPVEETPAAENPLE